MHRLLTFAVAAVLLAMSVLTASAASAQEDDPDEQAEIRSYGDTELIAALRSYGLMDQWIAASPVSAQASLLQVSGSESYQTRRRDFLDALDAWARRTEAVRARVAQIDAAQAHVDGIRGASLRVREALVFDDRLATDSTTLQEIEGAIAELDAIELPDASPEQSEDPLVAAEAQLRELLALAREELQALNGVAPAFSSSGIAAFVGFDDLRLRLAQVDLLLVRAREIIRPAQEQSEQLVSTALSQIPSLHSARLLQATDVGGLTVVTVDAYVRGAANSSCAVDWALLAGIGEVESNHGQLAGSSVASSGQVSPTIFGPLLDGGETETGSDFVAVRSSVADALLVVRQGLLTTAEGRLWGWSLPAGAAGEPDQDFFNQGNGFAVVTDSDGGALDGNDEWDRAVGPMQFLPETWSRWAVDGNADGVADPHNLYDAAATASRFLCSLSESRGASPTSFLLGYNSSTTYVRNVLSVTQSLRGAILPSG